ncbi:MAG: acylphosphatase [Fusobacterium sp. JB021]|nr:acylphosphatase [Fusobacterium sp. JB020]MDP0493979.1 acylphosphatase [Fusobacterium sp. JB021]MDP0505894.1 acylphosphatase [Fusobacterium sp. JB019]
MKSFKYIVKGRVQGVGYRFYVGLRLKKLGAKGYVKNLDNGDVEVIIQIKEDKLIRAEKYIEKGSPYGKVIEVKKSILEMKECSSFDLRY